MVNITFYQDHKQQYTGFDCLGHAEYAQENDIVCAATSALTINFINSVEQLTEASFQCDSHQETGMIQFRFTGQTDQDAQLLIRSLVLGLEDMERNYDEYIDVIFEEV